MEEEKERPGLNCKGSLKWMQGGHVILRYEVPDEMEQTRVSADAARPGLPWVSKSNSTIIWFD